MRVAGPSPARGGASRFDGRGAERRLRARLVGLQAGRAITRHDAQGTWRTAIAKRAIAAAIIGPEGIVGDAVADRRHHGGTEQAILAYATKHYPAWEAEWAQALAAAALPKRSPAVAGDPGESRAGGGALPDETAAAGDAPLRLPCGAFGENFTLDGVDESTVCIGDIWAAGALRLQISQPREPCYKPGRFWGVPEAAARMIATRRTGWYLRVLASERPPGLAATVTPGAELVLEARPYPQWTVARALEVFYACKASGPTADAAALAACPALSPKWRARLSRDG